VQRSDCAPRSQLCGQADAEMGSATTQVTG